MEYLCPICHGPLKRFPRKNKPEEYFWVCSQNCCYCDDLDGTPFLAQCVECKRVLSRRISPKTGQTYVACFNKEAHTSGQTIFYNQDGTPQTSLKAKDTFYCPECKAQLIYREIRQGIYKGNKVFICNNNTSHGNGRPHYFQDNDGRPILK